MSKHILVLSANVKYPNSEHFCTSISSCIVEDGNSKQYEAAIEDFKKNVEIDGFKIMHMSAYIISREQAMEIIEEANRMEVKPTTRDELLFIPNGTYRGLQSGYVAKFEFMGDLQQLVVGKGIRGIDVPCIIELADDSIVVIID